MDSAVGASPEQSPSEPLVSILTPSFNQRRWLAETIDSVARQTYSHLEHIVVDGGSSDGSVELLRSMLPPQCWTSERDSGQSHALNKAFERSHGEIIGWLNSDDAYLYDDVVERAVDHFRSNPGVGVVYGHAALVEETGRLLQVIWAPPFNRKLLAHSNFIVQPTVFMQRAALDDGFLDESFHYGMDHELWLRLAEKYEFSRIDRIVAIDRHQAERKSYLRPDLAWAEVRRLRDMYGIPTGRISTLERMVLRIGYRFRGSPAAFRLRQENKAFEWSLDGRLRLLLRQLAVKRRFMTSGEVAPPRR